MKISIQTEKHVPPQSKVENVFTQSLQRGGSTLLRIIEPLQRFLNLVMAEPRWKIAEAVPGCEPQEPPRFQRGVNEIVSS